MNTTITVTYAGIKNTPGDRDNMPKREHEFLLSGSDSPYRFKDIKLLQHASLVKGKQYEIAFDSIYFGVPVSIAADGITFIRKNNRIVSVDANGNEINHSDNPVMKQMGQSLRAHNLKLKAEGKPPIKPIKRRW